MVSYVFPPPRPETGMADDGHGIRWKIKEADGPFWAEPCASCGAAPPSPLTWEELLTTRGEITPVPPEQP